MSQYPHEQDGVAATPCDGTRSPPLRTFVFPHGGAAAAAAGGGASATTTATNIDAAQEDAFRGDEDDYVHTFDESASLVQVRTPHASSQAEGGAKKKLTAPAMSSGIPPRLSVEELKQEEQPPSSRRGQRVRFAALSSPSDNDGAEEASARGDAAANENSVPYGAGATTSAFEGGFDYTTVESETSEAESEALEPYSMITKTGGVRISLFTQVLALLQRTYRQYRRQIIPLTAEIISPLLFVVLIIILNVAFGKETIPEQVYASPMIYSYQLNSLDYQTYLCYNDSTRPILGLASCASLYAPYNCSGDESGIPVYGLCFLSFYNDIYQVVEQYVASMLGALITIPTLDSIISHQWIAKKAGLAADSRTRTALAALSNVGIGVSATTRYDSISYSGKLYFAPAANVPADLLTYIQSQSAMFEYVNGGTFPTVAEAESFMKENTATEESPNSVWGLVILNDITHGFDVQIRLHGEALPTLDVPVSVEYRSGFFSDGTDMYIASGFLTLQKVLYDYFYSTKANSGSLPNVNSGAVSAFGVDDVYTLVSAFPSISSKNPYLFSFASSLVAFILVLAFLYPFSQMTKRLVLEKELRIRESMCIMGLKRSSLWLNFLLVTFLEYLLICILLTILLCAVVATRSSSFTIFLILFVYSMTLIPLSGLLSTFFSRARMAALMSPLFYFILSMPIFAMGSAGRATALGLSILSPTGLAALLTNVFSAEAGGGFKASDLHSPYFSAKPYIILIILACDVAIYLLLMLYLDVVLPQEWGTRRHPLFFITEPYAYWQQQQRQRRRAVTAQSTGATPEKTSEGLLTSTEECALPAETCRSGNGVPAMARGSSGTDKLPLNSNTSSSVYTDVYAFDPSVSRDSITGEEKDVGVRIDNISKYFVRNGKMFAAVKNISWRLFRGEIAVLLGPNGAGKSTTINMVTGMLASDSGDCVIEGHSVSTATAQARHEIGYCPQHNILWPDLTCREHLEFYGKIKGLRGADLEDAVVDILRAVDLEEKIDCIPTLMSGGQKRKLSVAIAFVGRNRVVLLDEPTAGMDPAARRHTWSLLRVMAEHRTILLTTHYMDEADLLGCNVAIVNGGVMQCCGTTTFLRHYAGVGYTVRFDIAPIPTQNDDKVRQAKVEAVWARLNELVLSHLQSVRLVLQTDAEVEYEMQRDAEARIPEFLTEMESRGNRQLGIRSYALKAPTLEDVFMRVVEHQIPANAPLNEQPHQQPAQQAPRTPADAAREGGSVDAAVLAGAVSGNPPAAAAGGEVNRSGVASNNAAPLQRRLSRASLRFFNNESSLNYCEDVQENEESDDASATEAGTSFLATSRGRAHLDGFNFFRRASGPFGDGEAEEPQAGSPSAFLSRQQSSKATERQSSQRQDSQQQQQQPEAGEAPQAHRASDSALELASATPTIAAAMHPAGELVQVSDTAAAAAAGPPVNTMAVRNEAFLYKHVTDCHLDQVWATRANRRRGSLWSLQMRGMMYKRFYCAIRDRRMLFFQIVCPMLCILLAMLLQLVKNENNGTAYMSPQSFQQETITPLSSCTQYYGYAATVNANLTKRLGLSVVDNNFVSSADMSYQLLDTWHVHKQGRYIGLQCRDPAVRLFLTYVYPAALNGRSVNTILYNTSSHSSLPIGLHSAYAAAYFVGLGTPNATFEMSVTSLPLSKKATKAKNAIAGILIGVIVLIPFTFLPANPVAWVVKEYETRARHLQTVSGLRYLIYWASNLLFDFTAYIITIILVLIIFVIFQRSEYIGYATIGPTIVAFAIYGVCYCCASYMVSFFFSEHTTAQLVVLGVSFLTGFLCVMLVFVLSLLDKTLSASNTLRWIFRLLPPFSIGEVILNLALLEQKKLTDDTLTAWSMSITVWPDIYMAAEIPVFAAVTLLWDHPNRRAVVERLKLRFRSCCCCLRKEKKESTAVVVTTKDYSDTVNVASSPLARGTDSNSASAGAAATAAGAVNTNSDAASGTTSGRRGSAAITPAVLRRARAAGVELNADAVAVVAHANTTSDGGSEGAAHGAQQRTDAAFAATSPFSQFAAHNRSVVSPILRRRRASMPDSCSNIEDGGSPDGILVLSSPSMLNQRSADHLGSNHGEAGSSIRLPAVLFSATGPLDCPRGEAAATTPHQQLRRAGSGRAASGRARRQSTSAASQLTEVNPAVTAPPDMLYPPDEWCIGDGVCRREEDSDVEEERLAVYQDERLYLAEGHRHATQSLTPVAKAGRGSDALAVRHAAAEDHQPQSGSAPANMNADVIRVVDLRKVYDTPHKVAVSDLTFSVMHGEVFGFLGTNGAGKSSALSILTQEQLPTSGRAYVCGHDVVRDSFEAANCLGYCPQFDACLDLLTVKEHLRLYSLVRGVPTDRTEALVDSLLTICNLTEHRNVLSSDLSGGNRRKLSVAIALIGAPKVVCLDEPTSGLDPLARRLLWRALDRVSRKCSIILTTHHLEEVEALADCVGIMVDGGLRCFGDLPHLQHKYARNAYELTLCVSAKARQRASMRQQLQQAGTRAAGEETDNAAGAASPHRRTSATVEGTPSHRRNRLGSISYAGTDRIDTSDDIFQFMLRHFPSALLVDNFNNERYVYTLPATRDVANAMQRLQTHQQRRASLSFRRQSSASGSAVRLNTSNTIVRLSDVFEKLRASQTVLGITEYSVSQVSLEQVFLRVCGTTDEAKRNRRMSLSMVPDIASMPPMTSSTPLNVSRLAQSQQLLQQRKRRSSSVFVGESGLASGPVDPASPSRRRLSLTALGGMTKRVTFAEYRRQRALIRRRAEADEHQPTPSEVKRATEPDHDGSS